MASLEYAMECNMSNIFNRQPCQTERMARVLTGLIFKGIEWALRKFYKYTQYCSSESKEQRSMVTISQFKYMFTPLTS